MQINLSNTTHTLAIGTSDAGNVHYHVGYTDINSGSVTNPLDNEGIITTAATTTIVAAPSSNVTRKIQHLFIRNNGASSNTITIKKIISAVDYIYLVAPLLSGESIRIVNDIISILDSAGISKSADTAVSSAVGESRSFFKVGTVAEAAGQYYCFAKDPGFPGAWAVGTPGLNGRNTNGSLIADTGCINVGSAGTGAWYLRDFNISASETGQIFFYDILWANTGLSVISLISQSFTQPTLPPRDLNGTSFGEGVQAGILVTTATANLGIISNMTISYTNSDGVSGRTGSITSFPITAVAGTFQKFQLQAGDRGIRSIQSINLGVSLVLGSISIICFRELASASIMTPNVGSPTASRELDIKLYDGHCILPFWLATSTSAVVVSGNLYFINK